MPDMLLQDFPDVWRQQHPDAEGCYTVWDEKTSARAFNAASSWLGTCLVQSCARACKEIVQHKPARVQVPWRGLEKSIVALYQMVFRMPAVSHRLPCCRDCASTTCCAAVACCHRWCHARSWTHHPSGVIMQVGLQAL